MSTPIGLTRSAQNQLSGSPLTQILIYCLHFGCPEVIDLEIVQMIAEESTKDDLDAIIYFTLPYGSSNGRPILYF